MKHVISRPAVLSCLVIGLALSCGGGGVTAPERGMPSGPHPVIVIAIDGLRADSLGAFGGALDTPNFDALAAQSVHFQWAFAQAAEPAVTFAALLSGLYPTTSGVVAAGDRLPEEAVTLAEAVSAAGMMTAAFFEGAAEGDDYGLAQGFGAFSSSELPGPAALSWLGDHADDDFLMVFRGWSVGLNVGPGVEVAGAEPPEGFFERLQEVLASDFTDQPLAMDPEDLAYVQALYEHRVNAADAALGALMTELDRVGLGDRSTLVVTGTCGLDLEQHGATGSVSLHATVTRVPLFVRLPGGFGAGRSDKIVELIDVMPTVLELAGVEAPEAVQGASLVPIIEGAGTPPYIAFSESPHRGGQQAVALGGMRLIASGPDRSTSLYDLASDPEELVDVSAENPGRVQVLQRHLEAWTKMISVASLDPERRTEEELDDATLEQLKSLGYIQ
jgi:arylsulfatase A-like enzyme